MHILSPFPALAGLQRDPLATGIAALDSPRHRFLAAVREAAEGGADPDALVAELSATCSAGRQIIELTRGRLG